MHKLYGSVQLCRFLLYMQLNLAITLEWQKRKVVSVN